jgi:L-type amino acid transporter 9
MTKRCDIHQNRKCITKTKFRCGLCVKCFKEKYTGICFAGALTYAELGTTIPLSGGEHAYLMEAFNPKENHGCFGRIPAFLFDWISILLIRPSMFAIMCFTLGTYITQPFYEGCTPPIYLTKTFTILAMCKYNL